MKHLKDFDSLNESESFDPKKQLDALKKLKGKGKTLNKTEELIMKELDKFTFDQKWEMSKLIGRTKGMSKSEIKSSRPGYVDMWIGNYIVS